MKTKDQGFGEGYRGVRVSNIYTPTPLYPYTLASSLNRQPVCVSPSPISHDQNTYALAGADLVILVS